MTLDEAILHAEEVADKCALTDGNILCENDHRQLAEWLTDYKRLLEQQPCEDAISRADAEALFRNARSKLNPSDYKTADEFNTRDLMLLNAEQFIHLLPSVKLKEPKMGHWIGHREHCENLGVMPSGLGAYEWCSNCDCGIDAVEWHRNTYNYCPNCGIKMVDP